jgi:hypothetical protein
MSGIPFFNKLEIRWFRLFGYGSFARPSSHIGPFPPRRSRRSEERFFKPETAMIHARIHSPVRELSARTFMNNSSTTGVRTAVVRISKPPKPEPEIAEYILPSM